jgi:hypothetical protein
MKHFKLDLMTVLFIIVLIGVAVTMTTQASDQSISHSIIHTSMAQTIVSK